MKVFAFMLIVASATAIPLNHNKNVDEEDWQLVPDSEGNLHLVDIRNTDNDHQEIAPLFNAFNDVVFRLFTRSNPTTPQVIQINNHGQLASSNFNVNHPTRFHIHGWQGGGETSGAGFRNAYINRGEFNVFIVDWSLGARTPNYILARNRVNEAGHVIAQFIDFLNVNGVPFSRVGMTGHSLGAHVAGAAGKRTTRGRIEWLVGEDPAGPLFTLDDPANRLHHTDANHVESIITDAGRLGFQHPIGHANFYPNWGTSQPGCPPELTGECNHRRARSFMIESVNPNQIFGAIRCRGLDDIRERNCVVNGPSRRLGGEPLIDGPGIIGSVYFLTTNAASPFAQGPR